MNNFANKVAFVTGAASGIGLALCQALHAQGAKVMLADINEDGLNKAAASLSEQGAAFATVVCDVTKAESVQAAAATTFETFGNVHMLFNNAGVGLGGSTGGIPLADWQWITDINLLGVVYGVEAFVPHMKAHGEGGYIVNTASMAGHLAMAGMGPYHATKFAVVGYSESLVKELAPQNIGVSVLCPTWVKSNIHNTPTNRPSADENDRHEETPLYQQLKHLVENGMPADKLAELVLKSIQAKRLYIMNDPNSRKDIIARHQQVIKDLDACIEDLA